MLLPSVFILGEFKYSFDLILTHQMHFRSLLSSFELFIYNFSMHISPVKNSIIQKSALDFYKKRRCKINLLKLVLHLLTI